jgi:hypothetical protein
VNLHDVIRELIDVAAGTIAHLPPERAAELHDAVNESEDAAAVKVDGPDVAPEPVPVADQRAAGVAPADTVTVADQRAGTPAPATPGAPADYPAGPPAGPPAGTDAPEPVSVPAEPARGL